MKLMKHLKAKKKNSKEKKKYLKITKKRLGKEIGKFKMI